MKMIENSMMRRPITKETQPCFYCDGLGRVLDRENGEPECFVTCDNCNGTGTQEVER